MYANINTGEIRSTIPESVIRNGSVTIGPTLTQCQSVGWRIVTQIAEPSAGYAVDAYTVVDSGDGVHCTLTVASQHNISDSAAAALASIKAQANTSLSSPQTYYERATVALALLVLQELNTLRTTAGLATYTQAQLLAAIQQKVNDMTQ